MNIEDMPERTRVILNLPGKGPVIVEIGAASKKAVKTVKDTIRKYPSHIADEDIRLYLDNTHFGMSMRGIARQQGRHTSTILRKIRRVENRIDTCPEIRQRVREMVPDFQF